MHGLKRYLVENDLTLEKFSAAVGISKGYLSQLINYARHPSCPVALRISEATKGAVSVLDLLYPHNGKRKRAA